MGTVEDEIVSLCFFKGIKSGAINPFIDTLPVEMLALSYSTLKGHG